MIGPASGGVKRAWLQGAGSVGPSAGGLGAGEGAAGAGAAGAGAAGAGAAGAGAAGAGAAGAGARRAPGGPGRLVGRRGPLGDRADRGAAFGRQLGALGDLDASSIPRSLIYDGSDATSPTLSMPAAW